MQGADGGGSNWPSCQSAGPAIAAFLESAAAGAHVELPDACLDLHFQATNLAQAFRRLAWQRRTGEMPECPAHSNIAKGGYVALPAPGCKVPNIRCHAEEDFKL